MTPEETVLIRWIERTMCGEVEAFELLASTVKMCEECGVQSPLIDAARRYVFEVQRIQLGVPIANIAWLQECVISLDAAHVAMQAALNTAKELP